MNWDAIGAIGEIVGALAVVGTLAYLAVQIRQSNTGAKIAAHLEMTRQYANFLDSLMENPALARVFREGNAGHTLSDIDEELYRRLMSKCFWYFAAQHFQYAQKTLSEEEWHQPREMIRRVACRPGMKQWWDENKAAYTPPFVLFMDKEIYADYTPEVTSN